ncbi:hypothetical protein HYU95_01475 [Candidatus Daviesbacteria bacterium]|nr:hypothetical protein [Candidatus Daviesbacteria bacterium]
MKLIEKPITLKELKKIASNIFGDLVKCVVDVQKEIMVIDASMHADEEKYLLDLDSEQNDLWGINLYPDLPSDQFIEFDSMINIRPKLNNFSRGVASKEIREKIAKIVNKLIVS